MDKKLKIEEFEERLREIKAEMKMFLFIAERRKYEKGITEKQINHYLDLINAINNIIEELNK
ncbi:MAG: hypothetical protein LBE82_13660 [Chitinophagaceae bacterium]|jgi:hypothetical protein|nr:hypothetical protein [Chitinophagaceae bacterium]